MKKVRTDLYRHFDKDGNLLYVGISLSAMGRLVSHKREANWFDDIASVTIEKFKTRSAAEKAERKAIQNENPKHNTMRYKVPKKKKRKAAKRKLIKTIEPIISKEEKLAAFKIEFKAYKKLSEPLHGDIEDVTLDQVNAWAAEFWRLKREYPEFM
jgi:hypothetical protein